MLCICYAKHRKHVPLLQLKYGSRGPSPLAFLAKFPPCNAYVCFFRLLCAVCCGVHDVPAYKCRHFASGPGVPRQCRLVTGLPELRDTARCVFVPETGRLTLDLGIPLCRQLP